MPAEDWSRTPSTRSGRCRHRRAAPLAGPEAPLGQPEAGAVEGGRGSVIGTCRTERFLGTAVMVASARHSVSRGSFASKPFSIHSVTFLPGSKKPGAFGLKEATGAVPNMPSTTVFFGSSAPSAKMA